MTGFGPLPLDGSTQKFAGKAYILGPKWSHLPIITIGLLGVQIFWSVEMGYASPYLLSLGLSKSAMSLVFLAGPLSGLFMQPIIGVLADNSTSRFGRRRPFMMVGTIVCVFAMLMLGFTRDFASAFTARGSKGNDSLTVSLAVLSIYLIDFSINAVMAMDRALLVDALPPAAQASGNAWAARMLGLGSVVGFLFGTIPLPKMFPFLGTTELEVLSVIVVVLLLGGHSLMAICVKERVLLTSAERPLGKRPNPFVREARALWSNLLTLPPVIRQIFIIQFFAWIAWFPILFYTTIYVGDLYRRSTPLSPSLTPEERDTEATLLGTRALFYSSIIALVLNVVLPGFVATPATKARTNGQRQRANSRTGTVAVRRREGAREWLRIPEAIKVNLVTLWAFSHFVLAGCMFMTLFTDSVLGATTLISVTGFSWAITQWAPFSLLAEAILTTPDQTLNERNSILLADARTPVDDPEASGETAVFLYNHHQHLREERDDESDLDDDVPPRSEGSLFGNMYARVSRVAVDLEGHDDDEEDCEDATTGVGAEGSGGLSSKAGIILGIHNVFVVIPQFLVTGLSAVIFAIFDPVQPPIHTISPPPNPTKVISTVINEVRVVIGREEPLGRDKGSNSVVYIFRLGGVSALIAFILCWRLARELRHR
ncbi:General alpha-glucoside permease [Termitomyces sp. J132]|nr:hypothetical protein H2248_012234 [Termitomyces sp. 'cryptogamus']KNZ80744.1 General alpha-glucoside permease [Termitomyces sp. J132]